MNKSTKACLLSALVFPGVGHFYLKKYFVGSLLSCGSLLLLGFIISREVERALQILDKILQGEVQPDSAAIIEMLSRQAAGADMRMVNIASLALIFLWIIGIIDAYMVGRKSD
ncbi:hypothetical protein [Malonomonas rubra]|uniref:hypothetical protein n=1 Tax=Malonomonas rubra TaxID=57040 RepID=UPI0026F22F4F|nr:hypothetical protein [Malonomonas rubra]